MRLFIAEKPSLARAIADALPGPQSRKGDCIHCGNDVVAWCIGHILELAPPEAYGEELKVWRLGTLPIVPRVWKLRPTVPKLLEGIGRLLERATRVVHAGDPDREGQLLVDEVLEHLGYRGPVDRLLVSDLRVEAVREALAKLEPNTKHRAVSASALARQRADWLYGLNLTRLYTLLGREGGHDGVLSIGRVQTPLLGLIVARDAAIAAFQSVPFFHIEATLSSRAGHALRVRWEPEGRDPRADAEGRVLSRATANTVRESLVGKTAVVLERVSEEKVVPPPLPYALADLQIEASKALGLSAAQVLEAAQALYETHRLTTYPRSDCAYLPEGHHAQGPEVLASVAANLPSLAAIVRTLDPALRSRAWSDKRVTAHHAIIPTPTRANTVALSSVERDVYELVARRYAMQFAPAHTYRQSRLVLRVGDERLSASGRELLELGWKFLSRASVAEESADELADAGVLPPLSQGDQLSVKEAVVREKRTKAPEVFTDASLLDAMCGIARFVRDEGVRKILRESDGIGTPATRAAIIETLFARGYVVRRKRAVVSTETGRALIAALPQVATTPDLTAVWEASMRRIVEGEETLDAFLGRIEAQVRALVDEGRALRRITVGRGHACEKPGCSGLLRRIGHAGTPFWSCIVCRSTLPDQDGEPHRGAPASGTGARGSRRRPIRPTPDAPRLRRSQRKTARKGA